MSGCDSAGPGFERWDVDAASSGSRVSFTAWIDAEDVEAAAWTGATYHECFERVVRALAPVTDGAEVADVDSEQLTMAYLSAFAAALADTD